IAAENPVDFAPAPLVLYRQSPTGCLTHDMKADDRLLEMKTIMQRALKLREVSPAARRRAEFEIESQWASASLVNGKNAAALPHVLRAIAAQPASREGYRLCAHSFVPKNLRSLAKKLLGRGAASPAATAAAAAPEPPKTQSAPPVIIMNMFYSGLAIARDLAGTGVRVIGLSSDRKAYGNFTRFCEVRQAPDSQSEPEKLAAFLRQAATELKGAVIFPTRDADVVFLDRYRNELSGYRLSIPPQAALINALDKGALVRCAEAAGVPVPKSVVAHNADELKQVPATLSFPCVVKPVSSYLWRGEGKWQAVGCRKAFLADSWEQLREEYDRVAKVNPDVLVQEWIPGSTRDIAIMGGYFGENSEALGYFCARKLVQEPDDFGTGCVVQHVALQEIVQPSLRLCKSLGYRGMAEIEYKRDEKTGEHKLIEINTRHWDWHQLSHMSGVNLTRVAYSDLTGHKLDASTPARTGGKWVAEDTLLLHSAAGIYNRRLTLRTVFRQVSGPKIFGIFKWA